MALIPIKSLDNKLNINSVDRYAVQYGAKYITYNKFSASSVSSSSISFRNINPTFGSLVDRNVRVQVKFNISFTGTINGGQTNLLDGYGKYMACRALPLASSIETANYSINGQVFTVTLNDIIDTIKHSIHLENWGGDFESPTYSDKSQLYSELTNGNTNPLGSYLDGDKLRGGFNGFKILSNTPTSALVELTIIEPLFISPLAYFSSNDAAMGNVNNITCDLNFGNSIHNSLLSISDNYSNYVSFTNIQATPVDSTIFFKYYVSPYDIPALLSYDHYRIERYITNNNVYLSGGQSAVITNSALQIAGIPKLIYVYVQIQKQLKTAYTTDTFARIDSITLQFLNRNVYMSTMTPNQLYQMSVGNGLNMTWEQFYGSLNDTTPRNVSGIGSLLIINPIKDLGVGDYGSGFAINTTLQITVNYTSLRPSSAPAVLYGCTTAIVDDGIVKVGINSCSVKIYNSYNLVNEAPQITDKLLEGSGGSIFGTISNFLKSPIVSKGAEMACTYGLPLLKAYSGSGDGEGLTGGGIVGQTDELYGGKVISRKKLLSLMK